MATQTQVVTAREGLTCTATHEWNALAVARLKWLVKAPIKVILAALWSLMQDDLSGVMIDLKGGSSGGCDDEWHRLWQW